MTWVHSLTAGTTAGPDVIGGKGYGLAVLLRLGLPVPAGFVIGTAACRAFLRDGRRPEGLEDELARACANIHTAVSVRSGAAVSMPGMMDTILDVDPGTGLTAAVEAVFSSWHAQRARTYRLLHGIPDDAGTAVVVQAMVFGDRDARSGSGVAFSRDPTTGEPVPYGEFLVGRRGDAVVSGTALTRPLAELAGWAPAVWTELEAALRLLEREHRDACHVEFTVESGRLWFLQVRAGGLVGRAAVRVASDMADSGVISRDEARLRVTPEDLRLARVRRIAAGQDVLARGIGASPGVATGRVATNADAAVRMAGAGPVILVRAHTSPLDLHGLAVAAGVLTTRGGPASHAAVVARAMGKPAVVAATAVSVDEDTAQVRAGGRVLTEGTTITIDGTGGEVVIGSAHVVQDDLCLGFPGL